MKKTRYEIGAFEAGATPEDDTHPVKLMLWMSATIPKSIPSKDLTWRFGVWLFHKDNPKVWAKSLRQFANLIARHPSKWKIK